AFSRLAGETSSSVAEVIRAQLAARTIFAVARGELALHELGLPAETELHVRVTWQQMIERATRWLLHNRRGHLDIKGEASDFTDPVAMVLSLFETSGTPRQRRLMAAEETNLTQAGVPRNLAWAVARAPWAHQALAIVDLARRLDRPLELVVDVYYELAGVLGLDLVFDRVNQLERRSRWDTMARAALRDDLQSLHAALTRAALEAAPGAFDPDTVIAAWTKAVGGVDREAAELAEITSEDSTLARMSVALRTIRTLLV
ncbi:MAG: NAD-glutamate dehydrogenase, partial [Actinomycetes bacterium]